MERRHRPLRRLLLPVLVAAALAVGLSVPAAAAPPPGRGTPVTVMTRNLYLGADINRPIDAVRGLTDPNAILLAFGHANHDVRTIVQATAFDQRAVLLAHEIATRKPDLVGLQEVALWRHGPIELGDIGHADAVSVDYDFLTTLLDDLAAAGQRYTAVSVQPESDVEGPSFLGSPFDGTMTDASDVRLTMRDVILRRVASDVKVLDEGSGQYVTRIPFSVAGTQFAFIRGYNWADVRAGAKQFRFVNTHLESASSDVALAQANELLHGAAAVTDRPVVIVCDCNSDPLDGRIKTGIGDTQPHWAAYRLITGAGGFTDEWLQFAPAEAGFTSGLNEFVNDPDLSAIDHRIDMVFGRAAGGGALPVDRGWITGRDARTPTGLWASDHLGVVIRLRP